MYLSFVPAFGSAHRGLRSEEAQLTWPVGHSPTSSTVRPSRGGEPGLLAVRGGTIVLILSTDRSSLRVEATGILVVCVCVGSG